MNLPLSAAEFEERVGERMQMAVAAIIAGAVPSVEPPEDPEHFVAWLDLQVAKRLVDAFRDTGVRR